MKRREKIREFKLRKEKHARHSAPDGEKPMPPLLRLRTNPKSSLYRLAELISPEMSEWPWAEPVRFGKRTLWATVNFTQMPHAKQLADWMATQPFWDQEYKAGTTVAQCYQSLCVRLADGEIDESTFAATLFSIACNSAGINNQATHREE